MGRGKREREKRLGKIAKGKKNAHRAVEAAAVETDEVGEEEQACRVRARSSFPFLVTWKLPCTAAGYRRGWDVVAAGGGYGSRYRRLEVCVYRSSNALGAQGSSGHGRQDGLGEEREEEDQWGVLGDPRADDDDDGGPLLLMGDETRMMMAICDGTRATVATAGW